MSPTNNRVRLAARPVGEPKRSDFTFDQVAVDAPADGEVLVKVLYVSLDPAYPEERLRAALVDASIALCFGTDALQLPTGCSLVRVDEATDDPVRPMPTLVPDDAAEFWAWADPLCRGRAVHALTTIYWHSRSGEALVERFGA